MCVYVPAEVITVIKSHGIEVETVGSAADAGGALVPRPPSENGIFPKYEG